MIPQAVDLITVMSSKWLVDGQRVECGHTGLRAFASWAGQSGRVRDSITLPGKVSKSKRMNCRFLEFSVYYFWTMANCGQLKLQKAKLQIRTTVQFPDVRDMSDVTGWLIRF